MNEYLEKAIERYEEKGQLIHPISRADADIILEMVNIFNSIQLVEVGEALIDYKFKKDSEVLNYLKAVKKGVINTMKSQGIKLDNQSPEQPPQRYIILGGSRVDLYLLISYDSVDYSDNNGTKYCILLNPTPKDVKSVPIYANTVIYFEDKSDRDNTLSVLDRYFETTRGTFL